MGDYIRWKDIGADCFKQGKISDQEVSTRFAATRGGRLHRAIYFDDGDIALSEIASDLAAAQLCRWLAAWPGHSRDGAQARSVRCLAPLA